MKRVLVVFGGAALGVAVMLGILQPWKKSPARSTTPPVPAVSTDPIAEARGPIEEGRLDLARVLLKGHDTALAHALLALADIRGGELGRAQEELAKASALDPGLFEIALHQGHLEMLLGRHAAARRSYSEALERKPGDPKALAGRAAARFELKEAAGAVEDATAAIAAEPDALFTRASAYGALGRLQDALRDWTAYLARRPKDAHAWSNRGNANDRLGQKAAAIADWKQAMTLDPSLQSELEPLIKGVQEGN